MVAIAIDGPGGAGKSTISKEVANHFGYIHVDTGALYRAIGFYVMQQGKNPSVAADVIPLLKNLVVDLKYGGNGQAILVCGQDVTDYIRTPEVSMAASAVSAISEVREHLLSLQRSLAENNNVVMDGRDIGTVVIPKATVKIFLTATPEDRARRRYEELFDKGADAPYEEVLADLKKRDYADSNRAVAPLRPAPDAVILDTTGFPLEKSIQAVIASVKKILRGESEHI